METETDEFLKRYGLTDERMTELVNQYLVPDASKHNGPLDQIEAFQKADVPPNERSAIMALLYGAYLSVTFIQLSTMTGDDQTGSYIG